MPSNYVLLSKVTLTATGTSSITFSNIPQSGYTDLKLVISNRNSRNNAVNDSVRLNFNGVSTGYTAIRMYGAGTSTASSDTYDTIADNSSTSTANTFSNIEYYIPNYLGSNNKAYTGDGLMEQNATLAYQMIISNLWSNNAAIHTIAVKEDTGSNFLAHSTISLYGIAAVGITPVIAPFATGGDIVRTDGTYWIHTFLSSGIFQPNRTLTCDYLVVAGGGGGGNGGGGAGGYRTNTSNFNLNNFYTITVGSGGANNAKGSNSSITGTGFTTFSATGGGIGGSGGTSPTGYGQPGGSGGGGANDAGALGGAGNQGGYTPVEGYAGGNRSGSSDTGGGGGSSAVGGNATGGVAGAGGAGTTNSITGSSVTYAGGGGGAISSGTGGAGGTGGGGAGGAGSGSSVAGTINTGGGGGGGYLVAGSSGGSGIIVIRYRA